MYIQDTWNVTVHGCEFHDNMIGVSAYGSNSTIARLMIKSCLFRNQTLSECGQNIRIHGSGNADINIVGCLFTNSTLTGGTNLYINIVSAATGSIAFCGFPVDTAEGTTGITDNGLSQIGNYQARAIESACYGLPV